MNSENDGRSILATHALLCGLTPLIPLPFVDDAFFEAFLQSLIGRLAQRNGRTLTSAERAILLQQRGGCALGCVVNLLIYPLRKLLSKILFFLEWKRATDLIGRVYYLGFLLDVALEANLIEKHGASTVHDAIEEILARTNTSPVKRVAAGVLGGSKALFKSLSSRLSQRPKSDEIQIAQTLESAPDGAWNALVAQFQKALDLLPNDDFERLRHELLAQF